MLQLSVIVPAYNAEKYIERCIQSLLHQDIPHSDYEVIIIDDGSNDKTLDIVHQLELQNNNITVLSQQNQGQSTARNNGLNIAKGQYIWFVDADDYVEEDCLLGLANEAVTSDVDMFCFNLRKQKNASSVDFDIQCLQTLQQGVVISGGEALEQNYQPASACVYLYKRQFLADNKICFAQGLWQEDVDFNIHAIAYAQKFLYKEQSPYIYCWNEESSSTKRDSASVQKRLFDEIEVANRTKELCSVVSTAEMKKLLSVRYNSAITGLLLSLFLDRNKRPYWETVIDSCKESGLYPILRPLRTWKFDAISIIFNREYFLRMIYQFVSRF